MQQPPSVACRTRRQGAAAISTPETSILHQTVRRLPVASHVFLGSQTVDIHQEGCSLRSNPQKRHTAHLRPVLLWHTQETEHLGPGRWLRCTADLGQSTCQAPGHLSCSDLGRAQNSCPTEPVPLQSTREPERLRPGNCTKCRACFGQCPCKALWSMSSVDPESTCNLELGQTLCGPYTVSSPHTCQWYLFAVSLPPHNTTEQVSLNKWPPSPPCARVEIRHRRDLQTEEAKINKEEGISLEVTEATD